MLDKKSKIRKLPHPYNTSRHSLVLVKPLLNYSRHGLVLMLNFKRITCKWLLVRPFAERSIRIRSTVSELNKGLVNFYGKESLVLTEGLNYLSLPFRDMTRMSIETPTEGLNASLVTKWYPLKRDYPKEDNHTQSGGMSRHSIYGSAPWGISTVFQKTKTWTLDTSQHNGKDPVNIYGNAGPGNEPCPAVKFTMAPLILPYKIVFGPVSSWSKIFHGPVEVSFQNRF